ncbi:DUF2927 domain-containing protein [Vibrio sp. 404]|uniref:DUF2927 domain-containing protein n=1 Tax=Vibrio marinisediminis TaxID=2758441 RepID=A0A7W2ITL1_9VIBR|nr:DUF2927 domain-containing protein [Vibrio marinisediminis]MBA5762595.1 DUF2927 domain-containing protein [Vibrio marinisediminis]
MARIACLILALLYSISVNATADTWLDPSFVRNAFLDVALKNEYSQGDKPLVKWRQPIKIWVEHKVGDQQLHDQLVDAHIAHLRQITSHPISRVNSRQKANVIWLFSRESLWEQDINQEIGPHAFKNSRGAICKAGYRLSPVDQQIVHAAIIIPVDQSRAHGKLLACVIEEITQVMGLPNDSELAYPSIFNDHTPDDLLSPLDVILLKLLYEPELASGMNRQQVIPVLEKLILRYQREGILDNAVNVARSAPLRKMLQ